MHFSHFRLHNRNELLVLITSQHYCTSRHWSVPINTPYPFCYKNYNNMCTLCVSVLENFVLMNKGSMDFGDKQWETNSVCYVLRAKPVNRFQWNLAWWHCDCWGKKRSTFWCDNQHIRGRSRRKLVRDMTLNRIITWVIYYFGC